MYYWTVVPVRVYLNLEGTVEYKDAELPEDACAAGRIARFGRVGTPVETGNKKAYVTGPALAGKVRSIAASSVPRVYGNTPLVTWTPVPTADRFELQWSRTRYPFAAAGNLVTQTTSGILSLSPGVWYYRVRGIDVQIPKSQSMAWSSVRKIKVAKPVFRVVS